MPYAARQTKLDLDEKNIYRFGMGLNLSGLKDTSATTNIAIKAAYSLLDLRCTHLERNIKRFLRKIVQVVLEEINAKQGMEYRIEDVHFAFSHEVMSNRQENIQNEKTEAEKRQVEINTLLGLSNVLDDETILQAICDTLNIDYEEIKDKLPKEEDKDVEDAQRQLDQILPDPDIEETEAEDEADDVAEDDDEDGETAEQ